MKLNVLHEGHQPKSRSNQLSISDLIKQDSELTDEEREKLAKKDAEIRKQKWAETLRDLGLDQGVPLRKDD